MADSEAREASCSPLSGDISPWPPFTGDALVIKATAPTPLSTLSPCTACWREVPRGCGAESELQQHSGKSLGPSGDSYEGPSPECSRQHWQQWASCFAESRDAGAHWGHGEPLRPLGFVTLTCEANASLLAGVALQHRHLLGPVQGQRAADPGRAVQRMGTPAGTCMPSGGPAFLASPSPEEASYLLQKCVLILFLALSVFALLRIP